MMGFKRRFPKLVDEDYQAWIRTQPCLIFGTAPCRVTLGEGPDGQWWRSEPAHVKSKGSGGPDRGNLVPLCFGHHKEQHQIGIQSFQEKYGIDLKEEAMRMDRTYGGTF